MTHIKHAQQGTFRHPSFASLRNSAGGPAAQTYERLIFSCILDYGLWGPGTTWNIAGCDDILFCRHVVRLSQPVDFRAWFMSVSEHSSPHCFTQQHWITVDEPILNYKFSKTYLKFHHGSRDWIWLLSGSPGFIQPMMIQSRFPVRRSDVKRVPAWDFQWKYMTFLRVWVEQIDTQPLTYTCRLGAIQSRGDCKCCLWMEADRNKIYQKPVSIPFGGEVYI